MLRSNTMEQKNGDNSVNNQAQTIVINQGLEYVQVKEIFNDLFNANFCKMQDIAKETVAERVSKFQNEFIVLLQKENIASIGRFQDPEFQYTLFEAQKICAKRANIQYRELVSKALVLKIKNENNNLLDIVLSESISTIDKLLPMQLDILALCFMINRTYNTKVNTYLQLKDYIDKSIIPFTPNLKIKDSIMEHLEYCKCGTRLVGDNIEVRFQNNYEQIFYMPLLKEEVLSYLNGETIEDLIAQGVLVEDVNLIREDVQYLGEVYTINISQMEEKSLKYEKLVAFYKGRKLSKEQVGKCLINANTEMNHIVKKWNEILSTFTLTSVGLVIGAIHYENVLKKKLDLNIWI